MAAAPNVRCNDTQRDRMPIWMWDDETPKPIGAIDHDGWSYIYYGPHIDYQADFNLMAFNFAQAANNFVANAIAADNAPTYLMPPTTRARATHSLAQPENNNMQLVI